MGAAEGRPHAILKYCFAAETNFCGKNAFKHANHPKKLQIIMVIILVVDKLVEKVYFYIIIRVFI